MALLYENFLCPTIDFIASMAASEMTTERVNFHAKNTGLQVDRIVLRGMQNRMQVA
jgi:hypothetical protein